MHPCALPPSPLAPIAALLSPLSSVQALGIATKITKGTIEMVNDVQLVKAGERVGASQATLLSKLGIKPFKYGLEILQVRTRPRCKHVMCGFVLVVCVHVCQQRGPCCI